MSRRRRSLLLVAAILWLLPSRAFATFHLMRIVEVFPGTAEQPDAQYIMLQMYFGFQNFVSGHSITVFDATNVPLDIFTFASDVDNGNNQATILIATPAAQTLFSVMPDLPMTPVISPGGGKVCYESIDCVSWGSFSGGNTLPSPSGTPFNAPTGLELGMAIRRNLGADGKLGESDDTNNSATDFAFAAPAPKNNAGQTGSLPVSETPTPTTAPETTATPTPTSTPVCVGDCNSSTDVTVDELLSMVNIALGNADVSTCLAGDGNNSTDITIDEILTAVNNALNGCPTG
jgi:hypothetical protein